MLQLLVLFALTVAGTSSQFLYSSAPELVLGAEEEEADGARIRGFRNLSNKDFVVGGLFPAHSEGSDGTRCARLDIRRTFAIEAMLFAVDLVNADDALLPNLTLGYDIRDTCYVESVGLEEALELATIDSQRVIQLSRLQECSASAPPTPILGILGAAASRVSVPVAGLGRLLEVPQISYASTSTELSARRNEKYAYFFRTVIPDDIQARAQIALLRNFECSHLSLVYSDDSYGISGRSKVMELAEVHGICIDINEGLADGALSTRYQKVAEAINGSTSEFVLLFALYDTARKLLKAFANISNRRQLTWIGSDGWTEEVSLLQSYSSVLVGMFGTAPSTRRIDAYADYLSQLTVESNRRNPWFSELYSAAEKCTLDSPSCKVTESIRDYPQANAIPRTIEGLYAFAHALQDYLHDNCDQPVEWNRANYSCKGQKRALNGSTLLDYLTNVSFSSKLTGRSVKFNELGYIESGSYDIFNYQTVKGGYNLAKVGNWSASTDNLVLTLGDVRFRRDENGDEVSIRHLSQCKRCAPGLYLNHDTSRCGICSPCTGMYYSNDSWSLNCSRCGQFTWGNNPTGKDNVGSSHCVDLPSSALQISHPWSILVVVLSLLGLISVGCAAVLFAIYWKTPIIKSSGREQMILILVGITLSYMVAFIYVSPPVLPVCIIQRTGLWFCFSLVYGALMVKIVRIVRIFLSLDNLRPIRFGLPRYQVLFTFVVVAGQMLLVLGSLVHRHPVVSRTLHLNSTNVDGFATVRASCTDSHLAFIVLSLIYDAAILVVATVCGVVSFKYPKNFNEAKHISLCTFALVVIHVAFIPSYFATSAKEEFQNATVSLAIILTAFATLICNFAPRFFVLLFRKKLGQDTVSPSGYALSSVDQLQSTTRQNSITLACSITINHPIEQNQQGI